MSLLIKALEQAAKDRKTTSVEPTQSVPVAVAAQSAASEPTLEPLPRSRSPSAEPPREPAAPARNTTAPLAYDTPGATRPAATASLAALANIDAQQQRARAATVMQASGGTAQTMIAYFRGSPIMLLAAVGVIFGLGFGIYVYLQISNPGLFARQAAAPRPPAPAPAPPQAAPQPLLEPAIPGVVATAPGEPTRAPEAAATSGSIAAPAAASAPAVPSAQSPIPSKSVIGAATLEPQRESVQPRERVAEAARERGSVSPPPEAPRAAPRTAQAVLAAPAPEPAAASRERITVSSTSAQPQLNPLLGQAYTLLQSGNTELARAVYTRLIQMEPLNIDGLLGLAYIAALDNRSDDAMKLYLRILQLNPRHALAQAALIGLMGRADPVASETRLKDLIAREPSAFLHFVLGNLYSDQLQWAPAQQSYFQAHHLEPDNPDYAYNLAVGLDHLRQTKLALSFYRRAEQLATAKAHANFNLSHARERIRALSSQLE